MNFEIRKDWTNSLCVLAMTVVILLSVIWLGSPWGMFFLIIPALSYEREVEQPWDMSMLCLVISVGVMWSAIKQADISILFFSVFASLFTAGFIKKFKKIWDSIDWS